MKNKKIAHDVEVCEFALTFLSENFNVFYSFLPSILIDLATDEATRIQFTHLLRRDSHI